MWEVVSSYSSATAPDFHGVSSIRSRLYDSQRTAADSRRPLGGGKGFLTLFSRGHSSVDLSPSLPHRVPMLAAIILTLVVILYRVVFGLAGAPGNFSPMAAVVLCGAVFFPRRLAFTLPLAALLVSDIVLNAHFGAPMFSWEILPRYFALALTAGMGWLLRESPRALSVFAASLAGSIFFFVVTNTGSWLAEPAYAKTAAGWTQALTTGLPGFPPTLTFFRNSLASDMLFTALFLGCFALWPARRAAAPIPARTIAGW